MFGLNMLDELILAIVADIAHVALVRFVVGVAPLVIILVTNRRECPWTVRALVGLLASVDSHVDEQVAAFVEVLLAPHAFEEAITIAEGEH